LIKIYRHFGRVAKIIFIYIMRRRACQFAVNIEKISALGYNKSSFKGD